MQIIILVLMLINMVMSIDTFNNFADVSCGKGTVARRFGRIVGGQNAIKGEFPWMVSITRRGGHFCGGTIINSKFVLTAGHCLCTGIDQDMLKPANMKITMAQYDLTVKNSDAYQIGVKSVNVHPRYVCKQPKDDIAILELDGHLQWSGNVVPACFPVESTNERNSKYDDILATVAGWGWTHEDSSKGGRAKALQKARVNVVNTQTCNAWYKSQGKKTQIEDSQICAGYEQGGIDACWADSGGPLMAEPSESRKEITVIGVVSTGIGCARPYLPGIYTRVSNYIPWIRKVIGA